MVGEERLQQLFGLQSRARAGFSHLLDRADKRPDGNTGRGGDACPRVAKFTVAATWSGNPIELPLDPGGTGPARHPLDRKLDLPHIG